MDATNYRMTVERREGVLRSQINDLYSETASMTESLASKKMIMTRKNTLADSQKPKDTVSEAQQSVKQSAIERATAHYEELRKSMGASS